MSEILGSLFDKGVELVQVIDTPTKALIGVLLLLVVAGVAFFGRGATAQVKLAAFFGIVGVAVTGLVLMYADASRKAPMTAPGETEGRGAPSTGASTSSVHLPSLFGVVHAQSGGWIFGGKYDEKAKAWKAGEKNVEFDQGTQDRLPAKGDVVEATTRLDLYDAQPKYTLFGAKWKLGRKLGNVESGAELSVVEDAIVLGGNVWCRVRVR